MTFAIGLCMIIISVTSIILAQEERDSAAMRQDSAASILVSDSAIAEVLSTFSFPQNSLLLGKSYDPINPNTGSTYLGQDGTPNSGDEGETAVDEWKDFSPKCLASVGFSQPSFTLEKTIGKGSNYKVLAYRFNSDTQTGDLLVEGIHNGVASYIHLNIDLKSEILHFPGLLASNRVFWQGRSLKGKHANLYFEPSQSADDRLSEKATPTDGARSEYLNAVWSGDLDGFSADQVDGNLVACSLDLNQDYEEKGTAKGVIKNTTTLLGSTGGGTVYELDRIELAGTQELAVDTTDGPVSLIVEGSVILRDSSRIRNVRTDGQTPQVGELRIIQADGQDNPVVLHDKSCIENAFIYSPSDSLHLASTEGGCAGGNDASLVGVVWAEEIINSQNSPSARSITTDDKNVGAAPTSFVGAGIEVPENISTLTDVVEDADLPLFYRIKSINSWSMVGG